MNSPKAEQSIGIKSSGAESKLNVSSMEWYVTTQYLFPALDVHKSKVVEKKPAWRRESSISFTTTSWNGARSFLRVAAEG
jgi:hypothetical protein